ncbi:GerAB/ArcD/ProY family transporter [Neobacillus sp. NRS-1170]|uniref:GerAB/ArcD/ProY family transporter n=1 Tax=Neobacillus sp. NRS-1170 TaxID=3233898 RepID=UPI003D2BBC02
MENNKESISCFQMFFFIVLATIGEGILSFPNLVFKDARQASWISILITGSIAIFLALTYLYLHRRFPKKTIYEICMVIFGKWVGRLIIVGYLIYFFLICMSINRIYMETIKSWILTSTPASVILFLMFMLGIYLGKENLRMITRFFQLCFWIIIFLMLMNLGSLPYLHWKYLFPINEVSFLNILKGSRSSIPSFLGFDSLLIILPFVKGNLKSKVKSSLFSIVFITFTYIFVILTCILFFSSKELILIPQPILYLFKSITIFGVIERLDIIIVSLWIVMMMTSYVSYIYLTNIGIGTLFHLKKRTIPTLIITGLVYFLVLFIPVSRESIITQFKLINILSSIFSVGIPLLAIISSFLFYRKDMNEGEPK